MVYRKLSTFAFYLSPRCVNPRYILIKKATPQHVLRCGFLQQL
jgi:hypothetical protein